MLPSPMSNIAQTQVGLILHLSRGMNKADKGIANATIAGGIYIARKERASNVASEPWLIKLPSSIITTTTNVTTLLMA